jgi:hypothetical protein
MHRIVIRDVWRRGRLHFAVERTFVGKYLLRGVQNAQ